MTFTTSPAWDSKYYQVVVTSQYGSATSAPALLYVVGGAPSFLVDLPTSDTFHVGHVIQLHVVPLGTGPFTYQWQKNNVNISNDYRTSGAQSDTLTIAYAATSDSGSYTVILTGTSSTTSTADAVTVIAFPVGATFFAGSGVASGWSLQGTTLPILTNDSVQLTAGLGSTDRAAFMTTKQNVAAFSASFYYQDVSGTGGADGVTFCIQNQAVTAVGGAGGSLGYGGITPSVALALNIYDPQTKGISFFQNGTVTTPFYSLLPNVAVGANTNVIQVSLSYNGSVLAATLTDTVTGLSVSTNYSVNIPSVVGASTAWVGFTGGDGGVNSTQVISWIPPIAPVKLQSQVVGNSLVFTWPASAGVYLQNATSLGIPGAWSADTTDTVQLIGGVNGTAQVTVTPLAGERFFRLQLFQ
jgi:hypothetical protein